MFFFLVQSEQGDIFKVTLETDDDMVCHLFNFFYLHYFSILIILIVSIYLKGTNFRAQRPPVYIFFF